MIRNALRRAVRRRKTTAAGVMLAMFLAANVLAFLHARAMTRFVASGARTRSPETMSLAQKARVLAAGVRIPRPVNAATPADVGLPFETHRFRSADGTGLEAWHVPAPTGPTSRGLCVAFHGYAASKSSLPAEARAFRDMGYDVLLVDFRGSGGSDGNETTVGYREADDVAAAAAYAARRFAPRSLVLYGQSMGSAAILRAVAAKGVRPDAVVLECPFDRLLSTVRNRFALMGVPPLGMDRLLVFWGGARQGYWAFDHNPADYAAQVHCPTLLLHGADDPRVTRGQAESIYANLAGEKRLVVFEGVAHEAYAHRAAERWTAAVRAFLDRP